MSVMVRRDLTASDIVGLIVGLGPILNAEANKMPLTDKQIRNASARAGRVVKLSDGEGLQLWIQPTGTKLWNLAYRFDGKQRKLANGPFPSRGRR
jgi:hypothetical protein